MSFSAYPSAPTFHCVSGELKCDSDLSEDGESPSEDEGLCISMVRARISVDEPMVLPQDENDDMIPRTRVENVTEFQKLLLGVDKVEHRRKAKLRERTRKHTNRATIEATLFQWWRKTIGEKGPRLALG